MNDLFYTFQKIVMHGATEIFVSADKPLIFRLNGRLRKTTLNLNSTDIETFFNAIAGPIRTTEFGETGSTDFNYQFGRMFSGTFSVFRQRGLIGMVFRRKTGPLHTTEVAG